MPRLFYVFFVFFFNDTATTEIYTLSLHDALPIFTWSVDVAGHHRARAEVGALDSAGDEPERDQRQDRKSTRLNSSHSQISYAVFCLKKKTATRPALRSRRESQSHPSATARL